MPTSPNPGLMHFVDQADTVGHLLLFVLLAMSVASWAVILAKAAIAWQERRRSRRFLQAFWDAPSLEQAGQDLVTLTKRDAFSQLAMRAFAARRNHERHHAAKLRETGGLSDYLTRILRQSIEQETAKMENGLTLLASVGATAPFVGLFGTVWGVYRALVSIGTSGAATLDQVAGPVGEALIMTGIGLAVAIPAVLAYNALSRRNRVVQARLDAYAHDLFHFLATGERAPMASSSPALAVQA